MLFRGSTLNETKTHKDKIEVQAGDSQASSKETAIPEGRESCVKEEGGVGVFDSVSDGFSKFVGFCMGREVYPGG